MIHKTNIFAMVGGGQTPRHPKNKLMIWDDCTFSLLSTGQVYHRNQLQVRSQSHQNQSRTLYHSPLNQNFRFQASRLQSTRRHRDLSEPQRTLRHQLYERHSHLRLPHKKNRISRSLNRPAGEEKNRRPQIHSLCP